MRNKFYILFWIVISVNTKAQTLSPTVMNSTGGTAIINGIIYDYSVGEMTMISTFYNPKFIITQGLLQTKTDTAAVGIATNQFIRPTIIVYPNPAQQLINFESECKAGGKLQYELVDVAGKLIISRQSAVIAGKNKESIDLTKVPAGMYLLKITLSQDKEIFYQNSKIQKAD
jgi:hypothetical protein